MFQKVCESLPSRLWQKRSCFRRLADDWLPYAAR